MSIKVIKSKDVNTWLKQKAKNYYESGRMYAKSRSFISEVVQKEKEKTGFAFVPHAAKLWPKYVARLRKPPQ